MDSPTMYQHPEIFFNRRLIEVLTILRELDSYFSRVALDEAEKRLNTCNAYLEQMLVYADFHHINVESYQCDITAINHRFSSIGQKIEKRKNTPRWKGVFALVARAIGFVADLFGVGSVIRPLLGFGKEPPSLPPSSQ